MLTKFQTNLYQKFKKIPHTFFLRFKTILYFRKTRRFAHVRHSKLLDCVLHGLSDRTSGRHGHFIQRVRTQFIRKMLLSEFKTTTRFSVIVAEKRFKDLFIRWECVDMGRFPTRDKQYWLGGTGNSDKNRGFCRDHRNGSSFLVLRWRLQKSPLFKKLTVRIHNFEGQ